MSSDLQWSIIRNNSCFLVRSQGKTLTKEPNNVTGLNAFKYNGLVNKKVVGVDAAPSGKGVVITTRKNKAANKPGKIMNKITISRDSRRTLKTIEGVCDKNYYRMDLKDPAMRRACAILRSQKPTAGVQKKRSRRKRN
ncbi:predicted protein [Nematostella vectensis]|uniref:Large ribosomal subunit protein eL28 n=1 Tax=Nematostella vectensis TaxID=45351 RepID=A7RYT2_NEMVE|nr:60S ribosomal protein L28 [Nematostella vectensis]EDO43416.1 predicted protein [Nematostella vectensis]|eukprot:XP_001635479.1 predicted protein [Nematostella vectensis]